MVSPSLASPPLAASAKESTRVSTTKGLSRIGISLKNTFSHLGRLHRPGRRATVPLERVPAEVNDTRNALCVWPNEANGRAWSRRPPPPPSPARPGEFGAQESLQGGRVSCSGCVMPAAGGAPWHPAAGQKVRADPESQT